MSNTKRLAPPFFYFRLGKHFRKNIKVIVFRDIYLSLLLCFAIGMIYSFGQGVGYLSHRLLAGCVFGIVIIFSILLHELAHATVLSLGGIKIKRIILSWKTIGVTLRADDDILFSKEYVFGAAAGPLANLFLVAVLFYLKKHSLEPFWFETAGVAMAVNLILGFVNLVPTKNSDGLKIVLSLMRRYPPAA